MDLTPQEIEEMTEEKRREEAEQADRADNENLDEDLTTVEYLGS